jgi:hypothetical protein
MIQMTNTINSDLLPRVKGLRPPADRELHDLPPGPGETGAEPAVKEKQLGNCLTIPTCTIPHN